VMNTKMTGNAAQVHAIHIQLHRLLAHLIGVTMLFWFGSVLAATMHAAIPLRTAFGFTGSVLA